MRELQRLGFEVSPTGGNHWPISHPKQRGLVIASMSPSDR
jgi:predicted RNA binding protein YcfA (HicA-like mRNA interferase family)